MTCPDPCFPSCLVLVWGHNDALDSSLESVEGLRNYVSSLEQSTDGQIASSTSAESPSMPRRVWLWGISGHVDDPAWDSASAVARVCWLTILLMYRVYLPAFMNILAECQ